jgi:rhodanese-related sulfurtransferase
VTVPAAPRRPHRVGLAPAGVVVLLVLVLLAGGTAGLVAGRRRAAERETQDYLAERARAGAFTLSPLAVTDRLVTRRPTLILDVRSRREFADVRLRSARNLPLPDLLAGGSDDLGALPIVVVDRDGTAAVEGMVFLRLAGKPAFAMTGGMDQLQRLLARPSSIPRRSAAAAREGQLRALLTERARGPMAAGGGSSPAQVPDGEGTAEPPASPGLLPGILAGLVAFSLLVIGWRWFERRHHPVQDALSLLARDDE